MKYAIVQPGGRMGVATSSWHDPRTLLALARDWIEGGTEIRIKDQNGREWSFDDFEEFVLSGDADQ